MITPNISWAEKYRPQSLDQLVFPSGNNWKEIITQWLDKGQIDGNIALFGNPGIGKTTLTKILIKNLIKNSADIKIIKSRSVDEIDSISEFITSKPISSKTKLIIIEEADRLSRIAQIQLKDRYCERYQENASIIITSNYPNTIDNALLQRFIYKIDFNLLDPQEVFRRLMFIIESEKCQVNENELKSFIDKNAQNISMRELINDIQISAELNNRVIIFNDVDRQKDLDSKLIGLCQVILGNYIECKDPKVRKLAFINPLNSNIIGPQWAELVQTATNNYNINFSIVFEKLEESVSFLPLKQIIIKYMEDLKYKKYPHLHLISCICQCLECVNNII